MRTCLISLLILLLGLVKSGLADTYISVGNRIYEYLDYLEATGCVKSSILTTLPLSQKEVYRLVFEAENRCGYDTYVKYIVSKIKERIYYEPEISYLRPIDEINLTGGYGFSKDVDSVIYNDDGERFKKGYNLIFKVSGLFSTQSVSGYISPELRMNRDTTFTEIKEGYVVWSFKNINFLFGKESQWWGPGRDGSIILSNNAEPFTMIRIENEEPVVLPWIGLTKVVFFATRLDDDQKIKRPYLWGMRINIKPFPYFEIGLSRTALLGGRGRKSGLSTWIKSFLAINENQQNPNTPEPGDQRAGFDLKITVPDRFIPFQTYMEAEGEDQAGYLPYKWAYLVGIYFPEIPGLRRLSFRTEYARTTKVWYIHHIYGQKAYYYKGRVIGHHIGRYARSLWLEAEYRLLDWNAFIKAGYEDIYYYLTKEKEIRTYLNIGKDINSHFNVSAFVQDSMCDNFQGNGKDRNLAIILLTFNYYF